MNYILIQGMKVTVPQKAETYKKANSLCPKGYRLPARWELFKILERIEDRKKITDGTFMFFWSSLIEGDYVKGLCLSRSLDVGSYDDLLADSYVVGRVVFIEDREVGAPKKRKVRK